MSRLTSLKFASTLLLLLGFLPAQQAIATTNPANVPGAATCDADSMTSLYNCAVALQTYDGVTDLTTIIRITAMIDCSGSPAPYELFQLYGKGNPGFPAYDPTKLSEPPPGCYIPLGAQGPTSVVQITGTTKYASPVGFHRTANFGYSMIDIESASRVTLSNFTIYDDPDPSPGYISVDGPLAPGAFGAVFCGIPDPNSALGDKIIDGVNINPGDTDVHCPLPGYVTHQEADGNYYDFNAECYAPPAFIDCGSDISVEKSSDINISGLTIDHSQDDAVDVSNATRFYFLGNTVENSYYRGLTIGPKVPSTDVSIEGNKFFANRGAALSVNIVSSNVNSPSDISNNIFDHNQHGDAFACNQSEGCSGGQMGVTGSDFVLYGNTFINGFDDFYDPNVFDEGHYRGGDTTDGFSGCDLSAQCDYYHDPSLPGNGGDLTAAGQLWMIGGGVETGPDDNGPQDGRHDTPDVEITGPVSGNVVFSNNYLDYASYAISYDKPNQTSGMAQIYNNEMFQNSQSDYRNNQANFYENNNCDASAGCGSASDAAPVILQEWPTDAAGERSTCGTVNCLWIAATETWSPANTLSSRGNGTPILSVQCALQIYGPGGNTLLTTVQRNDATCSVIGGSFVIPASVAQHYTTVQVSFENVLTGLSSPKQVVTLAGMTPTITGVGTTTCSGSPCAWVNATDAAAERGNCAVGIYNPTTLALITTLTGASVTCASTQATFIVPTSISNTYSSIVVNYQNLVQGTWSKQATVTLSTGGGGGGGGGGTGCGTGTICQQQ